MSKTTPQLRRLWQQFECGEAAMVVIPFGPDRIRVAPPAAEAFEALAAVLLHHGYEIHTEDTDSYNCRAITGGSGKSLHSFGIAVDVNWKSNPYLDHKGSRPVRYSDKSTQAFRARDVAMGLADTDMTQAMIDDVARIATRNGVRVFEWGGSWNTVKDCMHFELDLSPEELAAGINPASVAGLEAYLATLRATGHAPASTPTPTPVAPSVPAQAAEVYEVIARDGLRLRSLPSVNGEIKLTLPSGSRVYVLRREDGWGLIDLQGDGLADGYMSLGFLRAVHSAAAIETHAATVGGAPAATRRDITGDVTPELAARMFPNTPKANIAAHLPSVLTGLQAFGLGDRDMVIMALATIRAETEGFLPISEGRSGFNTRAQPFDLYDPGTSAGRRLGNTQPGDGARFRGRGFVQLTGRDNYRRIGNQIGTNLIDQPELANDDVVAGRILAQFLKNCETRLRAALAAHDLAAARVCVNGGHHGLPRFQDAYKRGEQAMPS